MNRIRLTWGLLGLAVLSGRAAHAAVDLQIGMESVASPSAQPTVRLPLSATVKITNVGTEAYRGPVNVRLLMVPASSRKNTPFATKGISFPSVRVEVDLGVGAEQVVAVDSLAETIFPGSYLVGAVVNSTRAVVESSYLNNATPTMTPYAMTVGAPTGLPPVSSSSDDLYSDVPFVTPTEGRAQHGWRLFKRGTVDTSHLNVLFLAAHVATKQLIVADYGMQGEKGVGWANMGSATNEQGEVVPYDVYSQSPSFRALPSGQLTLLTLVNARENVVESNVNNNLDAHFFNAARIASIEGGQFLAAAEARSSVPVSLTIPALVGHFGAIGDQMFALGIATDWAEIAPTGVDQPVTLQLSAANLEPGFYRTSISAKGRLPNESGFEGITIPVVFQVFAPGSRLELSTTSRIEMLGLPGQTSQEFRVPVMNSGTAPLWFRAESMNAAITLGRQQEGFLLPGQRANVKAIIDTRSGPGAGVSGIRIVSTASQPKVVQVRFVPSSELPLFPANESTLRH